MKRIIPLLMCASGIAADSFAEKLSTPPQGIFQHEVAAQSEALLGAPLHRPAEFSGTVETVVDAWVSPSFGESEADWKDGQWGVSELGQPRYYALVTSGLYEGLSFAILDNGNSALELDLSGSELDLVGECLQIIPYWTLDTLLSGQETIGSATEISGADAKVEVRFFSSEPRLYKSADNVFFHYSGDDFGGSGWRLADADPEETFDDFAIHPGDCLLYRNLGDEKVTLAFPGYVQMAATAAVVSEYGKADDQYLSLASAVSTSLSESRLYESGAFAGTRAVSGARGDLLMVFDNEQQGLNKAATEAYYYYTGPAFGGPGWRKKGAPFFRKFDDAVALEAGDGFAIRKVSSSGENDYVWSYYPSYLQD